MGGVCEEPEQLAEGQVGIRLVTGAIRRAVPDISSDIVQTVTISHIRTAGNLISVIITRRACKRIKLRLVWVTRISIIRHRTIDVVTPGVAVVGIMLTSAPSMFPFRFSRQAVAVF